EPYPLTQGGFFWPQPLRQCLRKNNRSGSIHTATRIKEPAAQQFHAHCRKRTRLRIYAHAFKSIIIIKVLYSLDLVGLANRTIYWKVTWQPGDDRCRFDVRLRI